ncbi:MAG: SLBB domain-containing protein [Deltaproteobacteria bacterium]|nr:SLBB domain-containing protein [Deltaproteobacteria bacterium]
MKELPEEISPFEEYARDKGAKLKQFGYDLFRGVPSTFAPVDAVPVGPDYVLGPGDQLVISVWGKVMDEYSLQLDREGKVNFPLAGILNLAGLTFSEAKKFLELEMSRYYRPSEVKMNVSMGALRSLRIFVVGKAQRPGSYTLSSLSTLVNALFAAGGPGKVGTMRDIQVKRGGSTVVHFDLYDFLLRGDKTNDIRLQPEDVIFIPPAGPLAGIAGSVKAPGIYELKGESTVKELIDMAGGLNDIAFKGRLQIDRIVDNNKDVIMESNLDDPASVTMRIQPGDIVSVFSVVSDTGLVRLSGAVQREGSYGIGSGMTVKDLIAMAGGLKYYAYTEEAELTRVTPTQGGPVTEKIKINLKKALEGDSKDNIELKKDDFFLVRPVPQWELYRTVRITGEVRFQGTYTILKGETLSSLIERAGGYTEDAYLKGAVFMRESVRELQQKQLDEAIDRFEQTFLRGSITTIESALTPEEARQQQAAMSQRAALIARMKAARAKGRISIKLASLDRFKGSASDLILESGDTVFIPETPSQVQVMGSVYNQTAFVYSKQDTVSTYLKKAGGLTKDADDDELYVLKVDGTAVSKRASAGGWGMHWDSESNGWTGGSFMSSRLDPGDTVVVPEKIERIAWLKEVKDITQILYQIAVTAGVLIVAF